MSFQSHSVLRHLRALSDGTSAQLSFVRGAPHIIRTDDHSRFYDYTKYRGEIASIISALVKDGYLAYTINMYHFCLTDRGLHPHQETYTNVKSFLIKSVLVPIVVSVVTTLLTLWITELLQ